MYVVTEGSITVETCAAHVGVMAMLFVTIDKVSVCLSVCLSACVCVQVLWNWEYTLWNTCLSFSLLTSSVTCIDIGL